jgi:hypothetical protein
MTHTPDAQAGASSPGSPAVVARQIGEHPIDVTAGHDAGVEARSGMSRTVLGLLAAVLVLVAMIVVGLFIVDPPDHIWTGISR